MQIYKREQADGKINITARVGTRLMQLTRDPLPADADLSGFRQDIQNAPVIPYVAPEAVEE